MNVSRISYLKVVWRDPVCEDIAFHHVCVGVGVVTQRVTFWGREFYGEIEHGYRKLSMRAHSCLGWLRIEPECAQAIRWEEGEGTPRVGWRVALVHRLRADEHAPMVAMLMALEG